MKVILALAIMVASMQGKAEAINNSSTRENPLNINKSIYDELEETFNTINSVPSLSAVGNAWFIGDCYSKYKHIAKIFFPIVKNITSKPDKPKEYEYKNISIGSKLVFKDPYNATEEEMVLAQEMIDSRYNDYSPIEVTNHSLESKYINGTVINIKGNEDYIVYRMRYGRLDLNFHSETWFCHADYRIK